ncbi:hypothetical protein CEUSTIGMA_g11201.t1 [Chlamydomonas eustigma]|uniref:Membrane-associated protein n=1 Tax=Chlamydomonas eustigma TaxID=1157962 RepID=A0A250XL69_9CHLO|nr:hypothetical protein CEUSTIGMA_g11201.t1 [Chlamydomonas eustigma]|eukprot:GAX83776.1 hypothetical protein CEUSTIGMA_g11201.t1 [Chlamydomonas eustigma]
MRSIANVMYLIYMGLAICLLRHTSATPKWNLTSAVIAPSTLTVIDVNPWRDQPCTSVGTCVPYNFSLAGQTMWYWCGWSSIQGTMYVYNASNTLSVQLMRAFDVNNCALANLGNIKSCPIIYASLTDTQKNNSVTLAGIAFPAEICLVVANNGASKVNVSVQMFQYYDSSRYYGTVFSIFLTAILCLGVLATIVWTCYHEYVSPADRIHELRGFEAQLLNNANVSIDQSSAADADPSNPGTFSGKVKVALSKVRNVIAKKTSTA